MSPGPGTEINTGSLSEPNWEADIGSVRVLFGADRMTEAAELVQKLAGRRVLVVSDPGIHRAGHLERLESVLEAAGLEAFTFTDVDENPDTRQVDLGTAFARQHRPDCVIALGGGSGRMSDYWGFGLVDKPLLPAIGIPTTAGTGSEAQSYALITQTKTHRKMACGDPSARFRFVVLDPALLASVPAEVAAANGMDALSHALESSVSTAANPVSRMLAYRAWSLLQKNLISSLEAAASTATRSRVQLAAHLAGAAIEQSMLGAAHACANPLTARFQIPHGQAVALMLPAVMRFNTPQAAGVYRYLAEAAGLGSGPQATEALIARIEEMRRRAGLAGRLAERDVPRSVIPELAAAAAEEWTARFNPRPVDQHDLETIYEAAY